MTKKWATTFPRVPGAPMKRHDSKAAVYRWVEEQRRQWHSGALRSKEVTVKVDEGKGYFELYERIDLSETAPDLA